jgi:hypothetical protein
LQKEKDKLVSTNTDLQNKVALLFSKLENQTKTIKMLNSGSDTLDEILLVGKNVGNAQGIGFNYKLLNKQGKTHVTKCVPAKTKYDSTMSNNVSRHSGEDRKTKNNDKFPLWKCHYCNKNDHVKPYCCKLYGFPKHLIYPISDQMKRKIWIVRNVGTANITHTSFRASSREDWYFDNGCSRHMIVVKENTMLKML